MYKGLKYLSCNNNQLTSLPNLPDLVYLNCSRNQLTSLPDFPNLKSCIADDDLCPEPHSVRVR